MLYSSQSIAHLPNACLGTFASNYAPELGVKVYGSGVGDKVGQLLIKSDALLKAGFHLNPKAVLGTSLIDCILGAHGFSLSQELEPQLAQSLLSQSSMLSQTVEAICSSIDAPYLAVRSSGFGDARGTGVYKSTYCENNKIAAFNAVVEVLSSYFKEDGKEFRRRARIPSGFAVSLEGLLGAAGVDRVGGEEFPFFAPVLSGFAYTQSRKGPHIVATKGLADTVVEDSSKAIVVTPELVVRYGNSSAYMVESLFERSSKLNGHVRIDVRGMTKWGVSDDNPTDWEGINGLDFGRFFSQLKVLEQQLGEPQYVEWAAVRRESGDSAIVITQIAELKRDLDFFELPEHADKALVACRDVRNSCDKDVRHALIYDNPCDLHRIKQFNEAHPEGYLFIIDSRFLSKASYGSPRIGFSHYSNATAILVDFSGVHTGDVFSHFEGACIESGIVVGITEQAANFEIAARAANLPLQVVEDGLTTLEHPLRIIANGFAADTKLPGRTGLLVLRRD